MAEKKVAPIYMTRDTRHLESNTGVCLKLIDSLMNKGKLKFSEACQCYRLVRKGWSTEEALQIVNTRKGKKGQKKQMKNKKNIESLEVLKDRLNKEAEKAQQMWAYGLGFACYEGQSYYDALSHLDESSCEKLNSPPLVDGDTKDLMESNQDSLGMWS